ncbi:CCA tRNA nucleotidyltransferase [Synechococcus sp. Nb3U1]|uniref:CCA tRNA nucleotidyltransferase n=1 Tax=Synechococcus sp. Nb3U1 TaxID=1914529 RepID=UPI001F3C0FE2|nr:CCA tRNA nucleotidyltransferase [Synechococcus sp. Nb3U1]MCF2970758.1 CCA tRNA nucleotidyltransferase [Synechococcus sp. Nb3U1]
MTEPLQTELLLAEIRSLLPFPWTWLPEQAYWVGGSLRDACLGQMQISKKGSETGFLPEEDQSVDLDLVLNADSQGGAHHPVEWAAGVARRLGAGFVVLDAERQIARIVLPQLTLDVAQQVGSTPESDLWQRDFTCNALALDLHRGQLLDPTGGQRDIRQGRIRMVRPENLSADPVRLLRAYRQAAQLGFGLDLSTQEAIRERAHLLVDVAAERVRSEVVALLEAGIPGLDYLRAAVAVGLLGYWLPKLQPESEGLLQARRVWQWARQWKGQYPRTLAELAQPLADRRSRLLVVVLAALLWDPSIPADLPVEGGQNPAFKAIEAELEKLRFSRAELRTVQRLHHLLPQFHALLTGSPTPVELWRLYQQAGSLFGGLALLAVATGGDGQKLEPWLTRYEDPGDPLAHLVPLLDGSEVLHSLGAKPGPWVGQLLQALQEAQARGQVQTRAEALTFAHKWKKNSN